MRLAIECRVYLRLFGMLSKSLDVSPYHVLHESPTRVHRSRHIHSEWFGSVARLTRRRRRRQRCKKKSKNTIEAHTHTRKKDRFQSNQHNCKLQYFINTKSECWCDACIYSAPAYLPMNTAQWRVQNDETGYALALVAHCMRFRLHNILYNIALKLNAKLKNLKDTWAIYKYIHIIHIMWLIE